MPADITAPDRASRARADGPALPFPWNWDFANVFPSTAAQRITVSALSVSPFSHGLAPGSAYALLVAYAIGVPCLAGWVLHRRDA